jgi:hypothetical protein
MAHANPQQLFPNQQPLTLNANMGKGKKSYSFRKNELWYDANGLVHSISMIFDDGAVGNFLLAPQHKTSWDISEFITGAVAEWGVTLAKGKIMKSNPEVRELGVILNVGEFLAKKAAKIFVPKAFQYLETKDSAYFAIDTNELVFTEPIWMPLGK